jgi:hypothetical protein
MTGLQRASEAYFMQSTLMHCNVLTVKKTNSMLLFSDNIKMQKVEKIF